MTNQLFQMEALITERGNELSTNTIPDPNPADYVILEPGKLVVTYLRPGEHYDEKKIPASRLLSVLRFMDEVSLDSEEYKPVLALTKELKLMHHRVSDRVEISTFKVDS